MAELLYLQKYRKLFVTKQGVTMLMWLSTSLCCTTTSIVEACLYRTYISSKGYGYIVGETTIPITIAYMYAIDFKY